MSIPTGTVTFLFTDIEGSTRLAQQYQDTWEGLRARHHAILREAIESHEGYVFQIIGDAFCAAFSTAEDAVYAAVKAQIALHAESWMDGVSIKVRMGIHTGKAKIQENGEYHGYLAMSRGQRLMSLACGGQVLISLAVQNQVMDDLPETVSLRDLGQHRLKNITQPEHIYQLVIHGLNADFPPLKTQTVARPAPRQGLVVRLLGGFEIKFDNKPVTISSRFAQSLFAYLILDPDIPHRREKLAGMFWPDEPEKKARTYLRHELWRIRKALAARSKTEYLVADDLHIYFDSSSTDYWLDVAMLKNTREESSSDELINVLSVSMGELLPGFYEDWVIAEREHLQMLFSQRMARLLELLVAEKRWQDVLEWAERWISLGNGPEAAYRALMAAYHALGDRTRMTATYQRCVQALRELDLEPSEQTRALAFKQSPRLKIPIPLTSFIGREKELELVAKLISDSRLVTLTGSGGVGKTRLAIQVVADLLDSFPDGVWFLDLAPVMDPALAPNTLAGVLDLQLTGGQAVSYTDLIIGYLRSRRALIIFDNCEHLIEACAVLANSLLTSCEHLSILATSREPLRVSGEVPYRVPSLGIPVLDIQMLVESLRDTESVRLFRERASVAESGFVISPQNALTVARICQRLDGIPLAIELAAARVHVLGVEQILRRLDDRFNLLTAGSRSALPRHQTLRAAIEWSYDLLSEKERLLFQRLAVFIGGWTLEAAEAVCSGDGIGASEILDLLSQLVDKSLVLVDASHEETRYRRLETIRQYAREKFLELGEYKKLRDQHLAYFLELAEKTEQEMHGPDQVDWVDRLEMEADNLRAALDWCVVSSNTEGGLRLFGAWARTGRQHFNEMQSWFNKIRALPGVQEHSQPYARLLNYMGRYFWAAGDNSYARSLLNESQELWLKLGSEWELGLAENWVFLGEVMFGSETAQSLFKKSLELYQKREDDWGIGRVMFSLGNQAVWRGDYTEAKEQLVNSLVTRQKLGDYTEIASTLNSLGEVARSQGDYEGADKYYGEAIKIWRKIGNRMGLLTSLGNLAWVSLDSGEYHKAKVLFNESFTLSNEDGDKYGLIYCLAGFAGILGMIGKPEQAACLLSASVHLLKGSNRPLDPPDQKDLDRYIAAVRGQLNEGVFVNAWALGSEMTLEQAIAFALAETIV